jgi:hypothetical protein
MHATMVKGHSEHNRIPQGLVMAGACDGLHVLLGHVQKALRIIV